MILITGGGSQGRLAFALSMFKLDISEVFDCSRGAFDEHCPQKVIYKTEEFIKTADFDEFLYLHGDCFCDKIVITAETGCGLVPVDTDERLLREKTGRANCALARMADEVYRVVCGIGQRIK